MIADYLNQTASLLVKTGVDKFNQPSYAAPVDIRCRVEYKRRMVRNTSGQEIVSEILLITQNAVKSDDAIAYKGEKFLVIVSAEMAGLDGSIEHYEVRL